MEIYDSTHWHHTCGRQEKEKLKNKIETDIKPWLIFNGVKLKPGWLKGYFYDGSYGNLFTVKDRSATGSASMQWNKTLIAGKTDVQY